VLIKDIKDKLKAIFKAYGKTAKDKVDKVNKTELLDIERRASCNRRPVSYIGID